MIVMDGFWIMDTYETYDAYPKEAWIYLLLGICLMTIAYWIIQRNDKRDIQIKNDKDNRVIIDKIWRQGSDIGSKLFVILLVLLVIISIFDFSMVLRLINPLIFLGMVGYWFLFVMHDEGKEMAEEDLQPEGHTMRKFLRMIDYREHPFSLPLILFMMIIMTFLISKSLGFMLYLEVGGNPRYVMSLPSGTTITSGLAFACGFIYINHQCDFFGIRRSKQSDYKVLRIHFAGIIICGATFLIWFITLCIALFNI